VLARDLCELPSKVGDVLMRGRPVRVACVAVEHQVIGLQGFFEFSLTEGNRLLVVVRTYDFEIDAVAHVPPADRGNPLLRSPTSLSVN
jgi:hypothetical protein